MFRRKKKEDTIPPALAEIESVLLARIEEIGKIPDPAEQLLKYKALKKSTDGSYDLTKVKESKEVVVDNAMGKGAFTGLKVGFAGFWTGAAIGTAAFIVAGSIIGGGIALAAGALSFVGSSFLGLALGRKKGLAQYSKYTPEEKHATRMSVIARGIDTVIEKLVSSYTNDSNREANLKALEKSPAREQVLKEFPRITKAFNDYSAKKADIYADQALFTKQPPASPTIAPK